MITPIQRFTPPVIATTPALRTPAEAFTESAVDLNPDHQGNNSGMSYSGEEQFLEDEDADEASPPTQQASSTSLRVVA